MTCITETRAFWNSILEKHDILPYVSGLMEISNIDERGVSMLMRVLYLWFTGMIYDRGDFLGCLRKISSVLKTDKDTSCSTCHHIKSILGDIKILMNEANSTQSPLNVIDKMAPYETSPEKDSQLNDYKVLAAETELQSGNDSLVNIPLHIVTETVPFDQPTTNLSSSSSPISPIDSTTKCSRETKELSPVLRKQKIYKQSPMKKSSIPQSFSLTVENTEANKTEVKTMAFPEKRRASSTKMKNEFFLERSPSVLGGLQTNLNSNIIQAVANSHELINHSIKSENPHSEFGNTSDNGINSKGDSPFSFPINKNSSIFKTSKLRRIKTLIDQTSSNSPYLDRLQVDSNILHSKTMRKDLMNIVTIPTSNTDELSGKEKKLNYKQEEDMRSDSIENSDCLSKPECSKQKNIPDSGVENYEDSICITEDEILAELHHSSLQLQKSNSIKEISTKRILLEDSFDVVPRNDTSPNFAYKHGPVRKKKEKKQLQGWACKECEDYFTAGGSLDTQQKREKLSRCSRHRSKYRPIPSTPEGFWNPEFDD